MKAIKVGRKLSFCSQISLKKLFRKKVIQLNILCRSHCGNFPSCIRKLTFRHFICAHNLDIFCTLAISFAHLKNQFWITMYQLYFKQLQFMYFTFKLWSYILKFRNACTCGVESLHTQVLPCLKKDKMCTQLYTPARTCEEMHTE